jgi:hypothetical protein
MDLALLFRFVKIQRERFNLPFGTALRFLHFVYLLFTAVPILRYRRFDVAGFRLLLISFCADDADSNLVSGTLI